MNKTIKEFLDGDTYSIRYAFNGDIAYKCNEEVRKYMRNQNKEIERLNNIIKDLLDRQNEALRYIGNHLSLDSRYKHGNGDEELILVRKILNKHIKELKENK